MSATEKRRGWKLGDGAKKVWQNRKEARKKRRKFLKKKLGLKKAGKSETLTPIEQAEEDEEEDSSDYDDENEAEDDIFYSSVDFYGDNDEDHSDMIEQDESVDIRGDQDEYESHYTDLLIESGETEELDGQKKKKKYKFGDGVRKLGKIIKKKDDKK
jgi:hypothetical protein